MLTGGSSSRPGWVSPPPPGLVGTAGRSANWSKRSPSPGSDTAHGSTAAAGTLDPWPHAYSITATLLLFLAALCGPAGAGGSAPGVGAGHGLAVGVAAGAATTAVVRVAPGGAMRHLRARRAEPGPKPLAQRPVVDGVRLAAVAAPASAMAIAGQGAVPITAALTDPAPYRPPRVPALRNHPWLVLPWVLT